MFDHSDGKAWAVGVYNPILHAAPKKPLDGDYFPSTRDRVRFYEKEDRSLCFVPRIAPARINVDNINPNERQLPTDHKFDPSRFCGVLLSALDLVWFTEKDSASKSSYADWAGSIKKLEEPTRGVHKYFSDIVPGYYVKLDSSVEKKYAVLYAFRPFRSADGEPEIMVIEIDEKEEFVPKAKLQSIKGAQIIEVGGGNNSLCKRVVAWLKDQLGWIFNGCQVDSGTEEGQVDPAHVVEQKLGILDPKQIKTGFLEMTRKVADSLQLSDVEGDEKFMGVRHGRMDWIEITTLSKDPKVPHETRAGQVSINREVTEYDNWYNKQLLKAAENLQYVAEFAEKHKSGQEDISVAKDLMELLQQHEEAILKHLNHVVDWKNTKQAAAYSFWDDPYHKLDAEDHIRQPVHVPYMMSYSFLARASVTAATQQIGDTALHTENTVWSSKCARTVLKDRIKNQIERQDIPDWLKDEIAERNKCLEADETDKDRKKARRRAKLGAPEAGEPDGDTDEEGLGKAKPKKKAPKIKEWDPMNRKPGEHPKRGHVDDYVDKLGTDLDGVADNDRKVGVIACFVSGSGQRKVKHLWCVCNLATDGHWVSTQGQHQPHPHALKFGYAISSPNKKYEAWSEKPPSGSGRAPAASASSTGSTLAEADLLIAKDNIDDLHKQITDLVKQRDELHLQLHKSMDLGNEHLSAAASTANTVMHARAKQIRTTQEITAGAIAKMKAMRQHAHGFAELMLPYAVREQAPDHFSCWASFSGLLDDTQINEAFDGKKKSKSASSAAVYDISAFDSFAGPTSSSPAPNVPYNLTVAKVKASDTPADYEPLAPVVPIKVTFTSIKGKGPAGQKKRKRALGDGDGGGDGDGSDSDSE